jgi:hypothetical protein
VGIEPRALAITVSFAGPFAPRDEPRPYPGQVTNRGNPNEPIPAFATQLSWRDAQNNELPEEYGVYIVENSFVPVSPTRLRPSPARRTAQTCTWHMEPR